LPRGGLQNSFVNYTGKNDSQNPVRFIEKFERLANYENVQVKDRLYYFAMCLKDSAQK